MTDGGRHQEAEDLALQAIFEVFEPTTERDELGVRSTAFARVRPILARLVREGQIRELLAVADDQCVWCARAKHMPPATLHGESWWHYTPDVISRRCGAQFAQDRIAALRQEG